MWIHVFFVLLAVGVNWLLLPMILHPLAAHRHAQDVSEYIYLSSGNKISTERDAKDAGTIELSVIVPAYNEQDRLPKMLDETLKYLANWGESNKFSYEVTIYPLI